MTAPPDPDPPRFHELGLLLPPLLFAAAAFMGADFTVIALHPLKRLGVPYPAALAYAHWIVPAGCLLGWAAAVRRWSRAAGVVAVLACFWLVGLIPGYADRRVASVPVSRWLTPAERADVEVQLGGPICETGSNRGMVVLVAPDRGAAARAALARLGLAGPSGE